MVCEKKELISVIVPVYNVEKYLERCIKSIIKQSYSKIEIILIDDGSEDNSGYICDTWEKKDERVRVLHCENNGVSSARNIGLDNAMGQYICFVDADDYVSKEYVNIMYNSITLYKADISMVGYCFSSNENFEKLNTNVSIELYNYRDIMREYVLHNKFIDGVVCKLFSYQILADLRFDETIHIGEDALFTHLALEKCDRIVYKNIELYSYYQRNGSAMNSSFDERHLECKYVFDSLYERYVKRFPDLEPMFYKNKILCYCREVQCSYEDRSLKAKSIRDIFLKEVENASIKKIQNYCNGKELIRFILIRYIPIVIIFYQIIKSKIKF